MGYLCGGYNNKLSEAGGRVTDMNGNDFVYNKEDYLNLDGFVVSNGFLHNKILKGIKSVKF